MKGNGFRVVPSTKLGGKKKGWEQAEINKRKCFPEEKNLLNFKGLKMGSFLHQNHAVQIINLIKAGYIALIAHPE